MWKINLLHGPRFRLIQKLRKVDGEERTAEASITYTGEEILDLRDHFPKMRVYPAVLLLEGMAQTAIQIGKKLQIYKNATFMFGGIDKAKFRGIIAPGSTIVYKAKLKRARSTAGIAECQAYVNNELVAEATITFAVTYN